MPDLLKLIGTGKLNGILVSKNKTILLVALSALMLSGYSSANAAEPVLYDFSPNPHEQKLIAEFAQSSEIIDFDIADVDLNKDGLSEFIFKSKKCDLVVNRQKNYCNFTIAANQSDEKLINLGSFQAKAITLSNNFFKGIRDLHVYNLKENDYDYNIARWNPEKSGYEILNNGS